jgi:hypothetical protein
MKIQRASIACPSSVRRGAILYEECAGIGVSIRVMFFVRGQLVEEVAP